MMRYKNNILTDEPLEEPDTIQRNLINQCQDIAKQLFGSDPAAFKEWQENFNNHWTALEGFALTKYVGTELTELKWSRDNA